VVGKNGCVMPKFKTKGKIFCFHNTVNHLDQTVEGVAYAMCDDGRVALTLHLNDGDNAEVCEKFGVYDDAFTEDGESIDDIYDKFYPDGWELEFISLRAIRDNNNNPTFNRAFKKNRALGKKYGDNT